MAEVNDKLQVEKLETWFDPLEMFRQIAPHGIVNKQIVNESSEQTPGPKHAMSPHDQPMLYSSTVNGSERPRTPDHNSDLPNKAVDELDEGADDVNPKPEYVEQSVEARKGEAVAGASETEKRATYQEMSKITPAQCPFMNGE